MTKEEVFNGTEIEVEAKVRAFEKSIKDANGKNVIKKMEVNKR